MVDPKESSTENGIDAQLLTVAAETFSVSLEEMIRNPKAGMLQEWDSFGHLTLFMAIEEKMKIKFRAEEILALSALEEISQAIRENRLRR